MMFTRDLTGQLQLFIDCRFEQTVMVQLWLFSIFIQPSIEALFAFQTHCTDLL